MKLCPRCNKEKENSEFYKDKHKPSGLFSRCKICCKEDIILNKDKISFRHKRYYNLNKNKIKNKHKEYYYKNKERVLFKHEEWKNSNKEYNLSWNKKYSRDYYKTHKTQCINATKLWCIKNKDKRNSYQRKYVKQLKLSNSNFKIACILRKRIYKLLIGKSKSNSSIDLLGCNITNWKEYLQKTAIKNGYLDFNIDNYSTKEYHIDHIIPCSAFNLECSYHQKLCFNWTNTQILTSNKNLTKGDNY